MCRYARPYKSHYACFQCRKTFKRRLMSDILRASESKSAAKCPECGELMADMGLDFASPKKGSIKEWEHLQTLFSVGITFHSCGCSGPGYIPNSTEKLVEYLDEIKESYLKNLDFWRNRIEPITKQENEKDINRNWFELFKVSENYKKEPVRNQEGINYWLDRIKQIELKIEKVTIPDARQY